jgi:hypothetical protein
MQVETEIPLHLEVRPQGTFILDPSSPSALRWTALHQVFSPTTVDDLPLHEVSKGPNMPLLPVSGTRGEELKAV